MKLKSILQSTITNNQLLKISSIIFGYAFWIMLAQVQTIELNIKLPISFYNLPANLKINSPENIQVNLSGKRSDFYNLDITKLAVHINLEHISKDGNYNINVTPENIFLHNKIKLLNYVPANFMIEICNKESQL